MSIDPSSLKDATLEQIVQAISAKIEAKDFDYTEAELTTASGNIKTAISRINYAWNLQNSPIFRLPDHLILRIFEHLQSLAYESPPKTHPKWWHWLKVTSACRAWRRISIEGSSLWEDVHLLYKMPVSFLDLVLDRAGARQLAVHFWSCDYSRSGTGRDGCLKAIRPVADRIKSFTIHVTASARYWGWGRFPDPFVVPHRNLESFDLSYDAFYPPSSRHNQDQSLYRPDINYIGAAVILQLITVVPADQLKHLTLRHAKGWPSTRFGNLTSITLFGYADGTALAEAVLANPALRKLKLESIKYKERYSYDPERLVKLDGQTLELARCEPGVLSMFTLSSTCSLVITRTMNRFAIAYDGEIPELQWLPEDISAVRCLHELEEVHFSITRISRQKGWIAAEQKTVGYSTLDLTSGSGPKPSAIFSLTYHFDARTPPYDAPFESQYLLPHPTPWAEVTRASFDGFQNQFKIHGDGILKTLPNLRSLSLRRCDTGYLLRRVMPIELPGLESLRFEDEIFGADFGDTLIRVFKLWHTYTGLRFKDLKIITSSDSNSTITAEQMIQLKDWVDRTETVKAPGYRSIVTKYN